MNILEKTEPREHAGSATQARFTYQAEYIAHECIKMLQNPKVIRVFCEFHDDCVVEEQEQTIYYQVKGLKGKFVTPIYFIKEALPDMLSNFITAQGNCKSILATNTLVNSDMQNILLLKRGRIKQTANPDDLRKFQEYLEDWRKQTLDLQFVKNNLEGLGQIISQKDGLFDSFFYTFDIKDNLPAFSETPDFGELTLRDCNIKDLTNVLYVTLHVPFKDGDVELLYDMLIKEIRAKSSLQTRDGRYINRAILLEKFGIQRAKRQYFETPFEKRVEELENQTALNIKLNGKFGSDFIERANLTRLVTQSHREKMSKRKATAQLIDDLEYDLVDVCLRVIERYRHDNNGVMDWLKILELMETRMNSQIATDPKFKKLKVPDDFVTGLIWEVTSECNIEWKATI